MNFYDKEILALKKSDRFRQRTLLNDKLNDYSSNDYLGLSSNKKNLKKTYKNLKKLKYHSPKSSLLLGGYHKIHKKFEDMICHLSGFESAIVLGNGFMGNLAVIESLVRKNDLLVLDEEYHASGIMASALIKNKIYFKHNDSQDLENKLKKSNYNRIIICIEGIYSMSGDIANKDIFDIASKYNAILLVDEAHSVGVIGNNLLGITDYYNINITDNIIKLGTLGKALGSYGAYILASKHIISYLENRAKSIIYTTAPSLFDIELARMSIKYIQNNTNKIRKKIAKKQSLVKDILNISKQGLIFPIQANNNSNAINIQSKLLQKGFLVSAVRTPTVQSAIIRLVGIINEKKFRKLLEEVKIISGINI